jgi:ABC-type nitrate/sulfonate/bicarbonate transport system substrate-binding protein
MRVFANMEEMDIPFQQVGLNTTQRYIAKSPDMVRRVVKSIVEGVQAVPASAKRAISRYMQIKDEKVLEDFQQLKGTANQTVSVAEGFKTILTTWRNFAARTANGVNSWMRVSSGAGQSGYIDGLAK